MLAQARSSLRLLSLTLLLLLLRPLLPPSRPPVAVRLLYVVCPVDRRCDGVDRSCGSCSALLCSAQCSAG